MTNVMIRAVFFDLDDTLNDFGGTKLLAQSKIGEEIRGLGIEGGEFWARFQESDSALFPLLAQGNLSRDEYRERRFGDPLRAFGVYSASLVDKCNAIFMQEVNGRPRLFPDVMPTLVRLREMGMVTGLLTNGPSDGQRQKLDLLGLSNAVDIIAISEEVGFGKPQPEIFAYVLSRRGDVRPDEVLMVGDSVELDCLPAQKAGLRAVLLDRSGTHTGENRTFPRISALDDAFFHFLVPKSRGCQDF